MGLCVRRLLFFYQIPNIVVAFLQRTMLNGIGEFYCYISQQGSETVVFRGFQELGAKIACFGTALAI